jgi:hypothetical protein
MPVPPAPLPEVGGQLGKVTARCQDDGSEGAGAQRCSQLRYDLGAVRCPELSAGQLHLPKQGAVGVPVRPEPICLAQKLSRRKIIPALVLEQNLAGQLEKLGAGQKSRGG